METRQIESTFSALPVWFLLFKLLKVQFHVPPALDSGLQNTWMLQQRLSIWTVHHSFLKDFLGKPKTHIKIPLLRGTENYNFQWLLAHEVFVQFNWLSFFNLKTWSNQFADFDMHETLP